MEDRQTYFTSLKFEPLFETKNNQTGEDDYKDRNGETLMKAPH